MYEIRTNGKKVEKQFIKLLQNLTIGIKARMKKALTETPYPSPTYKNASTINTKIEKKGKIYCYEITGGDRILYDIYEKPIKVVMILFAGNDKDEQRFLKKYAK
jgi:hypothetical protein